MSSLRNTGSAVWTTMPRASLGEPHVHAAAPRRSISLRVSSGSHADTRAPASVSRSISGSAREYASSLTPSRYVRPSTSTGTPRRSPSSVGAGLTACVDLAVVRPGGRASTSSMLGRARQEEVRIDRDAVPADADARLVDVAVRLAVRGPDRPPGRRRRSAPRSAASSFANAMLTSRYVVSASLLSSAASRRAHRDDLRVQHRGVEPRGPVRGRGADAADELRVGREVAEDRPGEQPLRRERRRTGRGSRDAVR